MKPENQIRFTDNTQLEPISTQKNDTTHDTANVAIDIKNNVIIWMEYKHLTTRTDLQNPDELTGIRDMGTILIGTNKIANEMYAANLHFDLHFQCQ